MDWLIDIFTNTSSVAHIVLLYSLVIAIGVLLGKVKVGGISLGVTFVLFAGIVAGHIGFTGPTEILSFVQEFGLGKVDVQGSMDLSLFLFCFQVIFIFFNHRLIKPPVKKIVDIQI